MDFKRQIQKMMLWLKCKFFHNSQFLVNIVGRRFLPVLLARMPLFPFALFAKFLTSFDTLLFDR